MAAWEGAHHNVLPPNELATHLVPVFSVFFLWDGAAIAEVARISFWMVGPLLPAGLENAPANVVEYQNLSCSLHRIHHCAEGCSFRSVRVRLVKRIPSAGRNARQFRCRA